MCAQTRRRRAAVGADVNVAAAGLLQDMALLQSSERSRFGYKRAAKMIATGIDRGVDELVASGTLRDVPFVGPSSARIVTELVISGRCDSVERLVESSPRRDEVLKRRRYRRAYLSRQTMLRALAARRSAGTVSRGAYRGDLQMHSTWSDGVESIASLADAGLALGYTRLGLTDHSYGLPIARGMSMDDARRQHAEIDRLNTQLAGRFRVYKGIEANILADGSLDLDMTERCAFEFVVASPHSLLRRDTDQTARMVAAVREPGVAILGHPQGRMYNTRPGITADWPRVFREAAAHGVAIELDGQWHRQDMDHELASEALALGCLFALDSDAHSIGELPFTDYAIAHARIAGIPADRVVNCWEDRRFDAWLAERR